MNGASRHFLIAPLDWGLGHATRCVPIIKKLLHRGHRVTLAAGGRSHAFLKSELPALTIIPLAGYGIRYPRNGTMALRMLAQLPRIIRGMARERRQLERIIAEHKIDVVISDNRFGLHTPKARSIYITHQVWILCPPNLRWLEPLLTGLHRKIISKYDECWIPDYPSDPNLSGDLAHRGDQPPNARFIGPLSRFEGVESSTYDKWDLLIVLSGPEPQRTALEDVLTRQAMDSGLKTLLVRGVPEDGSEPKVDGNLTIVGHLPTPMLKSAMMNAGVIVARPGYSTIMDLAVLGRKAILIPTPGQTEQEYLAQRFGVINAFYCEAQEGFNLKRAMERVDGCIGLIGKSGDDLLEAALNDLES